MRAAMPDVPSTMRAVRIAAHGGPEVLQLVEVPTPTPSPDDVLVRVAAVALNNTDLWTRDGAYGDATNPDALSGWRGPLDFPRIQGADVAGRIVAVGKNVGRELIGRRVVIDPAIYDSAHPDAHPIGLMGSERDGGYAEFVSAPADRAHDVSDSPLSDDQLAALPTAYGTALGMAERGHVVRGETVLVSGASGGVGLALVQIARARGARVLAISSGSKLEAVRRAGAHAVLDRAEDLTEQIRGLAPDGIDVGLDVVAGDLVRTGLPLLREGGRWVIAGALGGFQVDFDVRRLYLHNAAIIGSAMHTPAHFDQLMEMARTAQVQPVISAGYPLAEAATAQARLAQRDHIGKLVLHP